MLLNFHRELKGIITKQILSVYPNIETTNIVFETPPQEHLGHIAVPCFPFAKTLKKNPVAIAEELCSRLELGEFFDSSKPLGSYLNFFISSQWLAQKIFSGVKNEEYGQNTEYAEKTIMVEYSSPNTNKPLHLGHCRNNVLGRSMVELFKFSGARVIAANLINDRGIHICKSMLAYQLFGEDQTPEKSKEKGDHFVGDFYVRFAQEERKNPEMIKEALTLLQKWEQGEEQVHNLWQTMNQWAMDGFRQTYQRMGDVFERIYYESETYKGGKELVIAALEKNICHREENGAIGIDLEDENLGKKILLRADGTSVYITQDINTTATKFSDYPLSGCIFVVGNEQENHFRVLFTILKKFGFEWAKNCEHLSYGMVELPEGKMKSREGNVIDLDDLLNQMQELSLEQLKEREAQAQQKRSESELRQLAESIGQAAIRFYILKIGAAKNITFDPKKSLAFEGMTGPYLQYTNARISTLLKKGEYSKLNPPKKLFNEWNEDESTVLRQLMHFPDTVQQTVKTRNPALLAHYTYDLCRLYNKFYYEHKILKAESETLQQNRLTLSASVGRVLQKCLNLLCIDTLERM